MKKCLFFYLYISNDFESNISTRLHKLLLSKYINLFDEANFVVAIDDYADLNKIKLGFKFINSVTTNYTKKITTRITINDKSICEVKMLLEDVFPVLMAKESNNNDEAIFFAHNKGLTNVTNQFLNVESVLRWIICLYYYSFEFLEELDVKFKNGQALFGPLKTKFHNKFLPHTDISNHEFNYPGAFYWINKNEVLNNLSFEIPVILNRINRFLAEDFPFFVNENSVDGHNNYHTINTVADLYHTDSFAWKKYLENYEQSDDFSCYEFQNLILDKLINNH